MSEHGSWDQYRGDGKPTPAPWHFEGNQPFMSGMPHCWVRAGTGTPPGGFSFMEKMTEADARLISAAPDLLAACEEADRLYTGYALLAQGAGCGAWINAIRDAVAKAKGTS